ncbi:MAG TPA: ATP-binding cassette domain-containing protein, partial [Polyangiaceae bacterium]|nr:ATP-binding cassette domain-containing protein [Polyangiaceae bacterium]
DLSKMGEGARAKWRAQNVGFVFQTFNLMPVLTAIENVMLPLLLTNLSSAERKERAAIALKAVGLEDRMKHYPKELSGGQEQRVTIARAIVTDPRIIVADEPTGDLDRKSAAEILTLMGKLNTEFGKTIIMVTHDPAAAERARVTHHLDKGQLAL